jgi:hypothetical protein
MFEVNRLAIAKLPILVCASNCRRGTELEEKSVSGDDIRMSGEVEL